jgi:REP element-mobilizing transposase RayT
MANNSRKESSTGIYHVMLRGINKEAIFPTDREKKRALELLKESVDEHHAEVYSYCIMSNHVHLVVKAQITELSEFIHFWASAYAKYYNYIHDRFGHVFQNRFKSECIEDERYFWTCIRYIHLNPEHAGIVKNYKTYRYSSIQEYSKCESHIICDKALKLIDKTFARLHDFEKFHDQYTPEIYMDTIEELQEQEERIAGELLREFMKKYNCSNSEELFERIKYRCEYKKALEKIKGISREKAKKLARKYGI